MGSWPASMVDWLALTLRAGDHVCVVHGRVTAAAGAWELPICPHCRQLVSIVRADPRSGAVRAFAEPAPDRCMAAERHPLGGGRVLVGWTSCGCPSATPGPGGHRIWTCRECTGLGRGHDVAAMQWPPHEEI